MNMLIVAGLIAFGLIAFIAAVFMAVNEDKASPTRSLASPSDATIIVTPSPDLITEQRSLAIKEEAQGIVATSLSAQIYVLREQAREIERRLSILTEIAERIEQGQPSIDSENYHLYEIANSART